MKAKYYFRGAGIGIIVTTLIFVVALAFYKPTMTDDEIKRAAAELGMVMEDTKTQEEDGQNTSEDATPDTATPDTTTPDDGANAGDTTAITFDVSSQDSSTQVVSKLFQAGLIDNESDFNTFLEENQYDRILQPGSCQLHAGMSYEEIAKVLTTKQEFR